MVIFLPLIESKLWVFEVISLPLYILYFVNWESTDFQITFNSFDIFGITISPLVLKEILILTKVSLPFVHVGVFSKEILNLEKFLILIMLHLKWALY